jgi:hypothetical protein
MLITWERKILRVIFGSLKEGDLGGKDLIVKSKDYLKRNT